MDAIVAFPLHLHTLQSHTSDIGIKTYALCQPGRWLEAPLEAVVGLAVDAAAATAAGVFAEAAAAIVVVVARHYVV